MITSHTNNGDEVNEEEAENIKAFFGNILEWGVNDVDRFASQIAITRGKVQQPLLKVKWGWWKSTLPICPFPEIPAFWEIPRLSRGILGFPRKNAKPGHFQEILLRIREIKNLSPEAGFGRFLPFWTAEGNTELKVDGSPFTFSGKPGRVGRIRFLEEDTDTKSIYDFFAYIYRSSESCPQYLLSRPESRDLAAIAPYDNSLRFRSNVKSSTAKSALLGGGGESWDEIDYVIITFYGAITYPRHSLFGITPIFLSSVNSAKSTKISDNIISNRDLGY